MLAIDIGNSRVKWAVFNDVVIQSHGVFPYNNSNLEAMFKKADFVNGFEKASISCVAAADIKERFIKCLKTSGCLTFNFATTVKQQSGITNSYKLPSKMGVDRWLAMIAANYLHNKDKITALCIIDCGTAITLDVLNAKGEHLGGLIMPGYQTMRTSLGLSAGNMSAGNILSDEGEPLKKSLNKGLGVSTEEAVSKGCAQIISGGLEVMLVKHAPQVNNNVKCIVTGGDGEWLVQQVSRSVKFEPYLVLQGLRCISL